MQVLITGGTGFIGSVVAKRLIEKGYTVSVLDNLSNSYKENVPEGAVFYECDITLPKQRDKEALATAMRNVDVVIHCAALAGVDESLMNCIDVNVVGGINVLEQMVKKGVKRIINSSSAAVYGSPHIMPIQESCECNPINGYGLSKLMFEHVLRQYEQEHGIIHTTFRYFNVVGPGENRKKETHLIPRILSGKPVKIYGDDHNTWDGTCMRDYVHVYDVADAHILAIEKYSPDNVFNIGTGDGHTVKEIIGIVARVTNKEIKHKVVKSRAEDPPSLVADIFKIEKALGYQLKYSIEEIIQHQWEWMQRKEKDGKGKPLSKRGHKCNSANGLGNCGGDCQCH